MNLKFLIKLKSYMPKLKKKIMNTDYQELLLDILGFGNLIQHQKGIEISKITSTVTT